MKNKIIACIVLLVFYSIITAQIAPPQPQGVDPYMVIVDSFRGKDYERCVELCNDFIIRSSYSENTKKVKLFLGMAYVKLKNIDQAILVFEEHDRDYPTFAKNEQIKYLLAKLYFKKKNYEKAEEILLSQTQKYPAGKYLGKAQNLLAAVGQAKEQRNLRDASAYMEDDEEAYRYEYSITKITWSKIACLSFLIATPVFYVLGNNAQEQGDSIYNDKYKTADSKSDADAFYKEADEYSETAATYKTMAVFSGVAAAGLFAYDFFYAGRVKVRVRPNEFSLNIQF